MKVVTLFTDSHEKMLNEYLEEGTEIDIFTHKLFI